MCYGTSPQNACCMLPARVAASTVHASAHIRRAVGVGEGRASVSRGSGGVSEDQACGRRGRAATAPSGHLHRRFRRCVSNRMRAARAASQALACRRLLQGGGAPACVGRVPRRTACLGGAHERMSGAAARVCIRRCHCCQAEHTSWAPVFKSCVTIYIISTCPYMISAPPRSRRPGNC